MSSLLSSLEEAVAIVVLVRAVLVVLGVDSWGSRSSRVPISAIALLALVAVPSVVQLVWAPVFGWLRNDPQLVVSHHQYWRLLTAVVVQDSGAVGTVFNLATLGVVAVLAAWFWGGAATIGFFFGLGALLSGISAVYGATSAGSSGATFGLAATVIGYALVRGPRSSRLVSMWPLAFGGLIWAFGNFHGMAIVVGAALGAGCAVLGVAPSSGHGHVPVLPRESS